MRCECGSEIKERWKFCKECGRPVARENKKEAPPSKPPPPPIEEKKMEMPSPREGGKLPFSSDGKRHLFFMADKEQDFIFDIRKHLESFKSAMPPILDEYYVKNDLESMQKNKPYGKTELLGHERFFSYQKKWEAQEYILRILFNLLHGRFSFFQTKSVRMKKPSIEVIRKIPLLFSDEELVELPLKTFSWNLDYEGKVYFTGRRFLLAAETVYGDASESKKNALKVILSFWIKPDFETIFSHLSISGFLLNLIPPGDDERFPDIYRASEGMWKKPIAEWEKASNHFAERLRFEILIVKGKSFENPGLGKCGAFINPVFGNKERLALKGDCFFVYPKKEEHMGSILEECVKNARPTDVCDLVAMYGFAREMELKRAASHEGYPVPTEKFRPEV